MILLSGIHRHPNLNLHLTPGGQQFMSSGPASHTGAKSMVTLFFLCLKEAVSMPIVYNLDIDIMIGWYNIYDYVL